MSARIKKNKNFLKYICSCDAKKRRVLIKSASPDEINSLCECILNVYKKNIPVSKSAVARLRPFKKAVSTLATKKKLSLKKKKHLLNQRGGALIPLLLSTLLPTLLSKLV